MTREDLKAGWMNARLYAETHDEKVKAELEELSRRLARLGSLDEARFKLYER